MLEERLQLTQFAVDHFTDSSIWLSQEGEILYVNEAACRSLGYSSGLSSWPCTYGISTPTISPRTMRAYGMT